ncbi:electron transfer flavoprotein subunit beta/FixA family protein [Flammeovirga yaeyamensis]|uniref:Electron transfer flavoprotein subunit beta n=1 Tax=Flammeovirga yaeyamensis TaxID=367791 RepID=A0AAX1N0G4_9BACT|nr:electron transfer flavoprotein subunit beta/FixA family protein [Flammeovirga yaeyamensis]MBB3698576.1 electron transfer flavoprotein beta subunit [Flammeovirga yaeyamensis]NMF34075.1 electron transfer flavoprotein subunit beta/FixA family protein [Flammeovirga yaeyamensis]QWG01063.1 electron transfer flavoprotein subunit beta/FixA family protein [Flammeovirga yaeyamensis]
MKILVCISNVPDTTTKIKFADNKLDTNGVQFIIGPYDDFALARAVEIKEKEGGSVTVLNVGLADTEPSIRKALAIGADDAVRINAEPTDSLFVAKQIVEYAKDKGFDMILMGRESSDFNSGLVHGLVGELMGIPSIAPAMRLEVEGSTAKLHREIEGGHEEVEVGMPFVAGCQEPIAEWKIPNMRGIMMARKKPLEVVEPVGVDGLTSYDSFELPAEKGDCKMVDAGQMDELVGLLKNEARVL